MSAIEHPSFALRAPSTGRRLETIAIAIGICLPVPLLAATGLSVPLPNVVERIAAALVPWAEPAAVETAAVRGTIVPTAAETAPWPRRPCRGAAGLRDTGGTDGTAHDLGSARGSPGRA